MILLLGAAAPAPLFLCESAFAQSPLPSPADAGRIKPQPEKILPPKPAPRPLRPLSIPETPAPETAKAVSFTLQSITIEGMSAFTQQDMADIYRPLIGQKIPLSRLWEIAGRITERYQQAGYFLSRAYVPAQEIENGAITLRVTEGYISDIQIEGASASAHNPLVARLKTRILHQKPARAQDLENALLLLNDIPGLYFEAVLSPLEHNAPDGTARLVLREHKTPGRGRAVLDNHGSRFAGPHRASIAYEKSLLPNQNTTLSALANLPRADTLWAVDIAHEIKILPEVGLGLSLGKTLSRPGYTLAANDIESRALNWGLSLDWSALRQRTQNLTLGLALEGHNTDTDLLDTPMTRDRVRALRLNGTYEGDDPLGGYNSLKLALSRGLSGLSANDPNDPDLSRDGARPDFTKLEATWQRSQFITPDWLAAATITGQRASRTLYSSEEIGFGGPFLGRAYDSSEITGDHGLGGSVEVQYTGLAPIQGFTLAPSLFYDIGKVWTIGGAGPNDTRTLADAGIGLSLSHPASGLSGTLTLAQPLTKSIDTPVYGNNGGNPRLYIQIGWGF